MNLADLTLSANELKSQTSTNLPRIKSSVVVSSAQKGATEQHLKRIERALLSSLRNGLPPTANLTRNVFRRTPASKNKIWDVIGSHSVVITSVGHLSTDRSKPISIPVTYVDPVIGKEQHGFIKLVSTPKDYPNHSVLFETGHLSKIFKSSEKNFLSISSLIGVF